MALKWLLGVRPLKDGARLLVLVDQFEELFRYRHNADDEANAFVALLLAATEHPNVYVVITMRSDFLGDCARHRGLPEAVNAGLYLTPRLDPEQMADAIRLPARVFSGEVEPALVKRLLSETGDEMDQLPLLQHAMMRLWDLSGKDKLLTLKEFERLGGLRQALNDHAEEAYRKLQEAERVIAETLFRSLVARGPDQRYTRRPVKLREIAELSEVEPERVATVVEVFRTQERSFIMPAADVPLRPDTVLDITHEALIRQ
jgi:hypothetical protein